MPRHADIHAIIARQDGSEVARQRCALVMRVISGELTLEAAAEQAGVSKQRLHELRERMTADAVASLEPQAPGRPAQPGPDPKDERIAQLEAELGRTRRDLDCALIRAEIAVVFGDRLGSEKNDTHRPRTAAVANRLQRRRRR